MKKNLLILFAGISASMSAQEIEIPIQENFNEIKVYNKIEATLIKSSENKIVVSGIDKEDIEAEVDDKILRVKSDFDDIWSDSNTSVTIYYKEAATIDVNEGVILKIKSPIQQENLTLSAQEGAKIITEENVNVDELHAKIYTGGNIYITGKAKKQTVNIKAGGEYEGKKLKTEDSDVKISAGGSAEVYATNYCKAKVNAGGSIYIYGNPSSIDKKTTFGGEIIEKQD